MARRIAAAFFRASAGGSAVTMVARAFGAVDGLGAWRSLGDGFGDEDAGAFASCLFVPLFPALVIPATTEESTNRPTIAAAKIPQPFARLRFFGGAAGGGGGTVTGAPWWR